MNREKSTFIRTFFEASLPAWLTLAALMVFSRGKIQGNLGLINLLALVFPGIWGALRLPKPAKSWSRRVLTYATFYVVQGAGTVIVMLASLQVLRLLGLYGDEVENLPGKLLVFGVIPGATFTLLRGIRTIPGATRKIGERPGFVVRSAGILVVLILLGGVGYGLASKPYAGHASWTEPRILESSLLADFSHGLAGWQTTDPSITAQENGGALHLVAAATALPYTVTWSVQPGSLPDSDGFRVKARSDADTYLTVELSEAGGGKYQSWAEFSGGDWKTLLLTDFLPSLDALDKNGKLDWEEIKQVNFYIISLEAASSNLWLDDFETVRIDHRRETPWLEASSEHFWIRYHASDQRTLADVQKAAEEKFMRISAVLGFRPDGRIPITIVSTHAELERQVGSNRSAWVNGTALPDSLVLLTPLRYSPVFNNHRYDDVFEVTPHELAHLLLGQVVGYTGFQEVPSWLNEGLASYLAGQGSDEQALKDAVKQGKLPSLQDLDRSFSGQAPIGDSYSMAKSATSFLAEAYGVEQISLLLKAMANGMDFDAALQQIAGIDSHTFEQQWQAMLMSGNQ